MTQLTPVEKKDLESVVSERKHAMRLNTAEENIFGSDPINPPSKPGGAGRQRHDSSSGGSSNLMSADPQAAPASGASRQSSKTGHVRGSKGGLHVKARKYTEEELESKNRLNGSHAFKYLDSEESSLLTEQLSIGSKIQLKQQIVLLKVTYSKQLFIMSFVFIILCTPPHKLISLNVITLVFH